MEIKQLKLKDLIPYANNPRKKQAIDKVASSIKEFGWQQPIVVDQDMVIVVGHTRYQAAQKLGLDKVPVQIATGLTDAQIKAYRLLDNRANQDALWDDDMLKIEVQDIDKMDIDLALTGFDEKELDKLLFVEQDGLTDEDAVPEDVEPKVKLGELWQLGNHRLLCGDSTSEADVAKLMDNQKADMVFTDPPYNVAFNGRSGKFDVIKNDNLKTEEFNSFIDKFLDVMLKSKINTYYICCNWAFYGILQTKLKPKACIVWAKNVFGLGRGYRHQHEFILFDGFIDASIKNESDLWQIKKDSKYQHPTQKPVELSQRAIKNSTRQENIVIDYFSGSGSTLIACEKTKRNFYGLELDPKYCDVIIKRWEDFTGQTAKLLERGTDTNSLKEEEQWQDQKNIKLTQTKSLN
jgi:site-specific DNA-methyltransferase (adenine-specific)